MNDGPNIVGLPTKPNEMRAAVESIKRDADAFIEMGQVMARIRRAHFTAYIAEGFTPTEALELCKKVTL